jgi:hypothetical protein
VSADDHYVVTIDVKHVTRDKPPGAQRGLLGGQTAEEKRIVDDVTRLVFTAASLGDALRKASHHIELMQQDEDDG